MATAKQKKTKKRWFKVLAPSMFNNVPAGETIATEKEELIGRHLVLNLMDLLHDMKKQHVQITFKINEVKEGVGLTEVVAYKITSAALKRQVRKRRDKIRMSFAAITADNKTVRIKPFIMTNSNANNSVLTEIQKQCRQVLTSAVQKNNYNSLIKDLVSQKLQMYVKDRLKKVYPIRYLDIEFFGLESSAKVKPVAIEAAPAETKAIETEAAEEAEETTEQVTEEEEPKKKEESELAEETAEAVSEDSSEE